MMYMFIFRGKVLNIIENMSARIFRLDERCVQNIAANTVEHPSNHAESQQNWWRHQRFSARVNHANKVRVKVVIILVRNTPNLEWLKLKPQKATWHLMHP